LIELTGKIVHRVFSCFLARAKNLGETLNKGL
jgi:hypothetical protein